MIRQFHVHLFGSVHTPVAPRPVKAPPNTCIRAVCLCASKSAHFSVCTEPAVLCVPSCSVAPASDEISGIFSMPDGRRAAGPHWQRQRWQSDGGSSESSDWIIHAASSSRSSRDWQQILSHIVKLGATAVSSGAARVSLHE